jgi:hypothetical protein
MNLTPVITIDVDWAPDFLIDEVAQLLNDAGVKATWFITHDSPAVRRLRDSNGNFEIGAHPNFLPGSTHGRDIGEVIEHMASVARGARVMRTHGLYQSSRLLHEIARTTDIEIDCSLFIGGARHSSVSEYWTPHRKLIRVSYVWEDSYSFFDPLATWRLASLASRCDGLAVIDFHPIHLALNDPTPESYNRFRQRCPDIRGALPEHLEGLRKRDEGARTMFMDAIDYLAARDGGTTLSGLVDQAGRCGC